MSTPRLVAGSRVLAVQRWVGLAIFFGGVAVSLADAAHFALSA